MNDPVLSEAFFYSLAAETKDNTASLRTDSMGVMA
jgi:hypothetical protein